jgi:hypothetical protein
MVNEPVKESSPACANALRGDLQDPAQYLTDGSFGISPGDLEVKRQTLGITETLSQLPGEVFPLVFRLKWMVRWAM